MCLEFSAKFDSKDFNQFVPNAPFLYPLMFSGGRRREHWEKIGQRKNLLLIFIFSRELENVSIPCKNELLERIRQQLPAAGLTLHQRNKQKCTE